MMGFLQRLSAAAQQTAPAVHPLVESLYSAPAMAEDPMAPARYANASQPQPPEFNARQSSPRWSPMEGSLAAHAHVEPRTAARPQHAISQTEVDAFTPLLPSRESQPVSSASGPSQRVEMSRESSAIAADTAADAQTDRATAPQPAIRLAYGLQHLPDIIERLVGAETSEVFDKELAETPSPKQSPQPIASALSPQADVQAMKAKDRRRPPQIAHPAYHPAAQADEIQIHIGRIEVLAVPQPAPRPVAAPARKGLSLDDYLSRRNGRAV